MKSTRFPTRRASTSILLAVLVVAGCTSSLTGTPRAAQQIGAAPATVDGYVPDGSRLTAFDDAPAVTRLDVALLAALQSAAVAAEGDGVALGVNSGWRSRSYQQWLLDEAIAEYGSYEEARRWVATPEESRHTSGDAVDVGPPSAAAWLESQGSRWGLCRIFDNEPWHFELVGSAGACPELVSDASG